MTRRETFLAALQCKPVDQMPFVFTVDGFNYPVGLPAELLDPFDMVAIDRRLGSYVHERLGPATHTRTTPNCTVETTVEPCGAARVTYDTPVGRLVARYAPSPEANTAFLVGRCVQSPADYRTLAAMVDDACIGPSPEGIVSARARLAQVGDDGILYSCGPSTPIMDLARVWVGLERLVDDLAERRDLVEATLEAMAARCCEEYEVIAATTPARVIVFWDDVTSMYLSPALFRRYVLPVYSRYAEICHRHGKLLVAHACGHLRAFQALLLETGIDAIDWVTPPPTGDVVFAEAQRLWRGRICIMGAPAPAILRFGTPAEVERHLYEILDGVDLHSGFVLMVPPPVGTPMANIERVREVVERVG